MCQLRVILFEGREEVAFSRYILQYAWAYKSLKTSPKLPLNRTPTVLQL